MPEKHVVVDGSNIATEGRAAPSLAQLDEAVRAFLEQFPFEKVTVVVDATFPNRIEKKERDHFEEAVAAGEIITPPAGAIGRGDAFILQIADRAAAVILSNDSFQEFHGRYSWLFDAGRLIGGKPVPHVGWVFMERMPVRGVTSRKAVKAAKKTPPTVDTSSSASTKTRPSARKRGAAKPQAPTLPAASSGASTARRSRRRTKGDAVGPFNDALPFLEFVAEHQPGSEIEGTVDQFSSHGAYVIAHGVRCYIPLRNLGEPPPRSARAVLRVGENRKFVVASIDAPRRGIDLALPGVVAEPEPTARAGAAKDPVPTPTRQEERVTPAKKAGAKRSAAKKTARKSTARKSTARKAPARKTAAKKSTARKSTARKSTKKASARKTAAKKSTARKSAARKSTAKKAAKKSTARKATKKASARKAGAKKTTARKGAARKSTARKTAAKKTTARKSTKRAAKKRTARKR